MTSILIVFTGLFIRLAIPGVLMIALVFLLRRLDAHWQEDAMHRQKIEAASVEEQTWELKGCAIDGMTKKTALHSTEPCWNVFRNSNGSLHEECLRCKVFSATQVLLSN